MGDIRSIRVSRHHAMILIGTIVFLLIPRFGSAQFEGLKWGFIDKTGEVVIEPRFDKACTFSEGLACVVLGGKMGYIDKTGKLVIEPQLDAHFSFLLPPDFHDGLACVDAGDKYGYIDKTGKFVIEPRFSSGGHFSEGVAAVRTGVRYVRGDNTGRWVYRQDGQVRD